MTSEAKNESSISYAYLFSKLEQLSKENSNYRNAFAQVRDVAYKVTNGVMSARMTHWDGYLRNDKLRGK